MIKMIDRTEDVINRVNKYLALVRYGYSSQEKLMRLHVLEDYYESLDKQATEEVFSSNMEFAEKLSKNLVLPLKVKGVFLTEGRPQRKYYTAEELSKAVDNPLNQKFPLMLDHKDNEAAKVIGMVDKIEYDPAIKGIRWWGHINDETFALNVIDKAIKQVSVAVFSSTEFDPRIGIAGKNLTFKELSLVMDGAEPFNSIEVA